MASELVKGCSGLWTSVGEFSIPPNAQTEAVNCVITDQGIIEPRKGMLLDPTWDSTTSSSSAAHNGGLWKLYDGRFVTHVGNATTGIFYSNGVSSMAAMTTEDTTTTYPFLRTGLAVAGAAFVQNWYFATNGGLYYVDSTDWTVLKPAGMRQPGPAHTLALDQGVAAAGRWAWATDPTEAPNAKAAYRVVWGRKDYQDRVMLSPPSGRTVVNFTSATPGHVAFVTGVVPAIPEVTTDYFFQVYRSQTVDTSKNSTLTPSDNLYLVYEGPGRNGWTVPVGSANNKLSKASASATVTVYRLAHGLKVGDVVSITVGSGDDDGADELNTGVFTVLTVTTDTFTYTDTETRGALGTPYENTESATVRVVGYSFNDYTPDDLLTTPLYTNPVDGDGFAAANDKPPACSDMTTWGDRMWFANTRGAHTYRIRLLGVYPAGHTSDPGFPAGYGMAAGDTITINGTIYTARAAPLPTPLDFKNFLLTDTSASPAVNIEATARALVAAINNNPTDTTIHAEYISGPNDMPGEISLVKVDRAYNASAFNVQVSRGLSWSPYLGDATNDASKNDAKANRIYYSKPGQPEAVPALNYIDVGAANKAIQRIVAQKSALFVFKEDGIFMITGSYPYRVDLLDSSVLTSYPKTIVGGEACIYGLFNLGVCRITSSGAQIISNQIADKFRFLDDSSSSSYYANYYNAALSDVTGKYVIQVFQYFAGYGTIQQYCYHTRHSAWTSFDFSTAAGTGHPVSTPVGLYIFPKYLGAPEKIVVAYVADIGGSLIIRFLIENNFTPSTSASTNKRLQYFDGELTTGSDCTISALSTTWASSTIYAQDAIVYSNGYWYYASTGGTSGSTAPTGAANQTDGSVTWAYLGSGSSTNYTAFNITNTSTYVPSVNNAIYLNTSLSASFTIAVDAFFGLITAAAVAFSSRAVLCKKLLSTYTPVATNTAYVLCGYTSRAIYNRFGNGNSNHYRDVSYIFDSFEMHKPDSVIWTDQNSTEATSDIVFSDTNVLANRVKRVLIPKGHQYANDLYYGVQNKEAGCYFRLVGAKLTYEQVSERNSR